MSLNTIYPPYVETFMPAFERDKPAEVTFSISNFNNSKRINFLHVSLVHQITNRKAFYETFSKDGAPFRIEKGILILPFSTDGNETMYNKIKMLEYDEVSKLYTLRIPREALSTSAKKQEPAEFRVDGYYKLQLRFDQTDPSTDVSNVDYLSDFRINFSEWSRVCLLKAIPTPDIALTNFDNLNDAGNKIVETVIPSFNSGIIEVAGHVFFKNNPQNSYEEYMKSYSISIYEKDNPENVLDSIGPVYTAKEADANNIY
jgi:hypothetical protein